MQFDPDRPQTAAIRTVDEALLVPFGEGRGRGICRPAGVYDAAGGFVDGSVCWRKSGLAVTSVPDVVPEAEARLEGTWLYGGMAYGHFGHFLCESIGRFWAQDHVPGLRGIVFLPKQRKGNAAKFMAPMVPWARICGARGEVLALNDATRIERLIVAPQGFGTGDMIAGQPEFRRFITAACGRDIEPAGAQKIYISRSRLFAKRGRYFGEARIEALLQAEGFAIFHPQDQPIEVQIAQYKAARVIVSSDSSALHLAAFFAAPGDRVGIVLRRPGKTVQDFVTQYTHFSDVVPVQIDALTGRQHQFEGAKLSQMSEIYTELDFARLGAALASGGFIADAGAWRDPSAQEIDAERADYEARLDLRIMPA